MKIKPRSANIMILSIISRFLIISPPLHN